MSEDGDVPPVEVYHEVKTRDDVIREHEEFKAFVTERFTPQPEEGQDGKRPRKLNYFKADADTRKGVDEARADEWRKYQRYNAAIPIRGAELQALLKEGHVPIPSQWIDVDKHKVQKGTPVAEWSFAAITRTYPEGTFVVTPLQQMPKRTA